MKPHITLVAGTRPETIKLAPLYHRLASDSRVRTSLLFTGQHKDLASDALSFFSLTPDMNLDVMRPNQTLPSLHARLLERCTEALSVLAPDVVVVQGDTTTALAAAESAAYAGVRIAHVEAGLRSGNKREPFPEEMNRLMIARLADWHYAPTQMAKWHLLTEGISDEDVRVVGNTGIDALYWARDRLLLDEKTGPQRVLITMHRRESFGAPLHSVCRAVRRLALRNPQVSFVWPLHPNPNVRGVVCDELAGFDNVSLTEPLAYPELVAELHRCSLVITDSGGLQEEASAFSTHCLVARERTERQEGVEAGVATLIGTDEARLIAAAELQLRIATPSGATPSPYGDGHACERIHSHLLSVFGLAEDTARQFGTPAVGPRPALSLVVGSR